jgi:drug/metabolite transporter (DMT)-like permease
MGVGALLLMVGGILLEREIPLSFDQTSIFAVLYLALAGSAFAFVALYWLFTRMEVTRVSLFPFITPIVAVILGWLILGEKMDLNVALGGSLILVGVILGKPNAQEEPKTLAQDRLKESKAKFKAYSP